MTLNTEELTFLKEEYEKIHNAFWECHKIYWQMTSIFLPIILGAGTLVIESIDISEPIILFFIWIIVISLLTFWFLVTKYLRSWNHTRSKRLRYIEHCLQTHYNNSYLVYHLNYKDCYKVEFGSPIFFFLKKRKKNNRTKKENYQISFSKLNEVLYLILLLFISLIFIEKFKIITNLFQCLGITC